MMANNTQIAELRAAATASTEKPCEYNSYMLAKCATGVVISELLDKLEAAEARIAELEINWEASKRAIGFYKKEIAKLKGDAVPVGEVRLSDYDDCGQRSAQVVCLHAQADWNNFPDGTKLFTHAQPVPVVVLPHVQREFVNQLRDIAATYGNTQQLRAHLSKAVDKFVAGITVKSTDSEGA